MINQKRIVQLVIMVALLICTSVSRAVNVKTIHGKVYKDVTIIDLNSYNFDFSYTDSHGKMAIKNLSYAALASESLKTLHLHPDLCPELTKKEAYYKSMSFDSLVKENEKILLDNIKKHKKFVLSKHLKCQVYVHRRSVKLLKVEDLFGGTIYKVIQEYDPKQKKLVMKNNDKIIVDKSKKKMTEDKKKMTEDKKMMPEDKKVEKRKVEKSADYIYIPSTASVYSEINLKDELTTVYPTGVNFDTVDYGTIALYELTLQSAVHVLEAKLVSKIAMLTAVNRYKNKSRIKHAFSNAVLKKENGEYYYPNTDKIQVLEIEPYTPFFDFSKDNPIPEELR